MRNTDIGTMEESITIFSLYTKIERVREMRSNRGLLFSLKKNNIFYGQFFLGLGSLKIAN